MNAGKITLIAAFMCALAAFSIAQAATSSSSSLAAGTTSSLTVYVGDCCAVHGSPGCANEMCRTCVCDADPYCCDPIWTWDDICVQEASNLCKDECRCQGTPQESSSAGTSVQETVPYSISPETSFSSSTASPPESYELTLQLMLDVGNDTDYEWTAPGGFRGPRTLDFTEALKRYVRGGCWCVGCVNDGDTGNCTVPVVMTSDRPGNLTVKNARLVFTKLRNVGEVGYGNSFRKSFGGCWKIQHAGGTISDLPIPANQPGGCLDSFEYSLGINSPPATEDAVNDAVYRLLKELDNSEPTGVIDFPINQNMSFQVAGKIGVQTLWGPARMRLIVWS